MHKTSASCTMWPKYELDLNVTLVVNLIDLVCLQSDSYISCIRVVLPFQARNRRCIALSVLFTAIFNKVAQEDENAAYRNGIIAESDENGIGQRN